MIIIPQFTTLFEDGEKDEVEVLSSVKIIDVNASAFSVRLTNSINNSRNILSMLPTINKPHPELLSCN